MRKKVYPRIFGIVIAVFMMLPAKWHITASVIPDEIISAVNAIGDMLTPNDESLCSVTEYLNLIDSYQGVEITWESSNTKVIPIDGWVERPAVSDKTVLLTAKLSYGGTHYSKNYLLTVISPLNRVVSSSGFGKADSLESYVLTEQGITDKTIYDAVTGTIPGQYATASRVADDGAGSVLKLLPSDDQMLSMISRNDKSDILTGRIVIEKKMKITNGFDFEVKNSAGKRIAKIQAAGNKIYSYSNFNTVAIAENFAFPADYFAFKLVADTAGQTFSVYVDDTLVADSFSDLPFMAESAGNANIAANEVHLGVYPRTSSNFVLVDYEAIKVVTPALSLDEVLDLLSEDLILGDNASLNEITSKLDLRERYDELYGVEIAWESNNTAIEGNGVVHRGAVYNEDVKLTATVTYDDKTDVKKFDVTVISMQKEFEALVSRITEDLLVADGENSSEIMSNLNLTGLETLFTGAQFEWHSSNSGVIAPDGTVTRPDFLDAAVRLTMNIKLNGMEAEKVLNFTVKRNPAVYTAESGVNILIEDIEEAVTEDAVSLSLKAKTTVPGAEESLCVVMYLYDANTGRLCGIDADEQMIGDDFSDLRLTVTGVGAPNCARRYYVWDSVKNHKPLYNLPPAPPLGLNVLSSSTDNVTVAWETAFDDFENVEIYRVYNEGMFVGSTTANTFQDSRLDKGQENEYAIEAVDEHGFASDVAGITASTKEMPKCVIDGNNIILAPDGYIRCYIESATYRYGYTEASVADGVKCRVTTEQDYNGQTRIGQIPFVLSDNFLNIYGSSSEFALEITYFDEGTQQIRVYYDNTNGELSGQNATITMTNTGKWKTSAVILTNAKFRKSTNAGNSYANIRIATADAGFKMRKIGIMPLSGYTADAAGFIAEETMFSLKNVVFKGDSTQLETRGGRPCIAANGKALGFTVPALQQGGLCVEVQYYDDLSDHIVMEYSAVGGTVKEISEDTGNSGGWRRIKLCVDDAAMDGAIDRLFDFRIKTQNGSQLYVKSVRIYEV